MSEAPERIWAVTKPDDISADILGDVYAQQVPDWMVGTPVEYVRADRIEELEAKLAKAVEALDGVMVGGNHLATILTDSFPPAETEPCIALETMGYGYDFEVWCCWRSIMLARTTLAELKGQNDE